MRRRTAGSDHDNGGDDIINVSTRHHRGRDIVTIDGAGDLIVYVNGRLHDLIPAGDDVHVEHDRGSYYCRPNDHHDDDDIISTYHRVAHDDDYFSSVHDYDVPAV